MTLAWEDTARAAGFRKSHEIQTSNTTTARNTDMRVVGEPTMPKGYIALVGQTNAVIMGPKGAFSVSWPEKVFGDSFDQHLQQWPVTR